MCGGVKGVEGACGAEVCSGEMSVGVCNVYGCVGRSRGFLQNLIFADRRGWKGIKLTGIVYAYEQHPLLALKSETLFFSLLFT